MKVKCLENSSKTLPYYEGFVYEAEPLPGGVFRIIDEEGKHIIAPMEGHYLTFSPM